VQQESGTTDQLQAVCFRSANEGFIAGYGTLLRTVNGGATWTNLLQESSDNLYGVYFSTTDGNYGIAVGSGYIYVTEDGGKSWFRRSGGSSMAGVSFKGATGAVAVGRDGAIFDIQIGG
jgi:photosystem II stability/assembly factor-like uncharacterized protein